MSEYIVLIFENPEAIFPMEFTALLTMKTE